MSGFFPASVAMSHFIMVSATTAFHQVAQTITALSLQDERIADEFRTIEKGRVSSGKIVEIEGDVPVGMNIKFGDFAGAISTRIWDSIGRANWRSFEDARDYARSLHLKTSLEWKVYARSDARPSDIPMYPRFIYSNNGWRNWKDWLGHGRSPMTKNTRSFSDARAFAHSLGLRSFAE